MNQKVRQPTFAEHHLLPPMDLKPRIREPFVRTQLVPVLVPTSWQPEVNYFLSPYKTILIGISFKKNSRVCVPEKMNFRVILQPAD
jgi:hypothetical protein